MTIDADSGGAVAVSPPRAGLWRNRDFMLLWTGESVSLIGTAVSYVALPLVGVIFLHANAFEMGLLATVETLPALMVGAFVGVLADHLPRKALMISADIGRFLLLGWIPFAAAMNVLSFWQLAAVALGVGTLSVLFNVTYQAYLPNVVGPAELVNGNGKLAASQSVAEVSGPGIAGWLMIIGGPPLALVADAFSYIISAACLAGMRTRDVPAGGAPSAPGLWKGVRSGFILLWRDPILRTATMSAGVMTFFAQMQIAIYFLFLADGLHFSPGLIGILFAVSGIIGFLSAIFCDRLTRWLGLGRLIAIGQLVQATGGTCLAIAGGPRIAGAVMVLLGEACFAMGIALFSVSYATLRQQRTSDETRGRVVGASRFLIFALLPVASLVGGGVGALFGLRSALIIGAIGMVVGASLVCRRRVALL